MKKLLVSFSCVIASASLLLSCSSSSLDSTSSTSSTIASSIPIAKRFETVFEMRDAYIVAGGECFNWQTHSVMLALGAGSCADTNVLSVYSSREVAEEQNSSMKNNTVEEYPEFLNEVLHILIGENWILNDPDLETLFNLQDLYGGDYITSYTQIP